MSRLTRGFLATFYVLCFLVFGMGPWLQHIITCLDTERWGFLIAGAILPFIGWVHGIGIWMGVW